MKLQACSKIITLAALGFTLTAAGAFYSLISAEHTIDANYQQELKERFTAVGADLNHYVQRINGDYYELINSSLSNILALDQSYYRKDPLLNFFEQNIRTGGAYSSGENLVYALEGLNYFGVPYIAYNLDSKELTVHGLKDHNNDESTQHLLKARNQNGQTLEEMISEPQTLAQSFTIFYSGSDTYLCLRLFDQDTNSNYYIVSSYLEVLDNIALNLKKVFSDIDPMLQGILKDDAVMIVRRGQPILKSKDFDLALDMSSSHLRELIGVRLIDQDGNLLDDASSITQEHQASILAVSYVRSINSYLLVKRPFDLIKSDTSLILLAKIFTIVLSLLSVGLIARVALKDNQGERRKLKMLSSLVRKLNDMSPADFKQRLQQAYVDLQPQAAHTPNSDVTAAGAASATATSADSAAETTSNNTEADSTTATDKEQTANVEAASAAHAAPNTSAEDVNGETASDVQAEAKNAIETEGSNNSSAQGALAHDSVKESEAQAAVSQQASDSTEKSDAADATQSSAQDTNAEHVTDANTPLTASASDATEKSSASLSANSLSPDSGTSDSHDSKPADSKSNMESVTNVQLNTIKPEDVTAKLVMELCQDDNLDEHSPAWQMLTAVVRLAQSLELNSNEQLEELKQEFKARIPLYRKEGQCIAARQMLLNALPSEESMPSSNFVDFAAFTVPARELSGNFYTIQRLDDDNLAFVIGDCESSGTKAAYTVAVVSILVSEALKLDLDPPHVMQYLNERLCTIPHLSPVSLFIGMISEKTGNVIAANAGHCVPIVVDDTGPHFVAPFNEQRLGINKEQNFELVKWYLANDDMVMLYSKGILNVKNAAGEIFGMDRLLDHCVGANALQADELVIKILNDIKQHKGKRPFREDVSLICLKQLRIRF